MSKSRKPFLATAALLAGAMTLAACSSSDETETPSASPSAMVPQLAVTDFTSDYSAMAQLTGIAAQGKGLIQVLLPDTRTSARYEQFDAPNLKSAFEAAGLPADQFKISNAEGSTTKMQTDADAAIAAGASVLLVDALDDASGAAIQQKAVAEGVKVIDYDRLTLGGPTDRYYVSFDNVQVGETIGTGLVDCVTAWGVKDPNVLVLAGAPTDNNAKLFKEGYMKVLQPKFDDGSYKNAGEPAGSWDAEPTQTTFEQEYTNDSSINAVVAPNDNTGNAVIASLKKEKTPAKTVPVTGQDATTVGLQNVLTGYQCGTVYKPVFLEAQAAAALALILRAGEEPPATLVTETTEDTKAKAQIPSIYTTPTWVTSENMAATVVKDGAAKASELCAGDFAEACSAAGIS